MRDSILASVLAVIGVACCVGLVLRHVLHRSEPPPALIRLPPSIPREVFVPQPYLMLDPRVTVQDVIRALADSDLTVSNGEQFNLFIIKPKPKEAAGETIQ